MMSWFTRFIGLGNRPSPMDDAAERAQVAMVSIATTLEHVADTLKVRFGAPLEQPAMGAVVVPAVSDVPAEEPTGKRKKAS